MWCENCLLTSLDLFCYVGCYLTVPLEIDDIERPILAVRLLFPAQRQPAQAAVGDRCSDPIWPMAHPLWSWRCEALDGRGADTTDHDEIRGMGRVRSRRRIAARTQASYTRCLLLRPMPMTTPREDLVGQVYSQYTGRVIFRSRSRRAVKRRDGSLASPTGFQAAIVPVIPMQALRLNFSSDVLNASVPVHLRAWMR